MERITIFIRTTKKEGDVKLRFRLRDGEEVQLYHKTDIKVSRKDIEKFELDGSIKGRITIYNRDLKESIDTHMAAMHKAYINLCEKMHKAHISAEIFEEEISAILNEGKNRDHIDQKETFLSRFGRYIEDAFHDNYFNERKYYNYLFVKDSIERFLIIKHYEKLSYDEITSEILMEMREFFFDEYKYVTIKRYAKLFDNIKNKKDVPKKRRAGNTVVGRMKKLQALFNELLDRQEIKVSPFQLLGRKRKAEIMREEYDDPRFLRKEEFLRVMETEVPKTLEQTKDLFLLMCALGCRIGEMERLGYDKIRVSEDGIPYVHYLPPKTVRKNPKKIEIETPIIKFALDIIKKWDFNFSLLNYAGGEDGFNKKIRELLELCGINREVSEYNPDIEDNEFHPLYEYGSSKLCRTTHEDMMHKVQINLYVSGLHKVGSKAIHRYTKTELGDKFALMCVAFDQPLYKVDKELNVIECNE